MDKKTKSILITKIKYFKKNINKYKFIVNNFFLNESTCTINIKCLHSAIKTIKLNKKICLLSGAKKSINRRLMVNRHVLNRLLIKNNLFFFKIINNFKLSMLFFQ